MLIILGTVRLPPERVEAAREAMGRMVENSRAEDGCLAYAYAEDLLEPGLVHVVERWRDEDALQAHFRTPHMAEWRAALPALQVTDRRLFRYDADDGAPL